MNAAGTRDEVLRVERVCVSLGGRNVLDDVSFRLAAGEFCGLIGTNGSGKTTLLRTIAGFQPASHGRVLQQAGSGPIGYVPQKTMFDPYLPLRARDLVSLGLDGQRPGLPLPSRRRAKAVDDMLDAVDARAFAGRRIGDLSGGQQQRVLIAHALIRRPRLLLLDEPLASLDMRSASEIVGLLRRLSVEHGIAVLLSAHDMNPLLPVMDRIVYLANGRAASGPVDEVVRTDVLSALYGYHIDVLRVHGRVLVVAAPNADEARAALRRDPVHAAQVL
ncbi:metal ABC transporter ATP-binding protein [Burkholderia cenocepacia]|uniref:metal ABC transporter ATP-binding protein n=1 Tax=Burkholderia cenocepacia TaxID=95486 RepID=UPI0028634EFA|nr:metal ABC transporter ATP-binding protein [Burkholderia cenocepacia]MDR5645352.1 metal ABC transporter ATP-binding protein [Burkholderia cenocepacia]